MGIKFISEGWVSSLSLRVGIKFISEGWVSNLSLRGGYQVYLGGVGIKFISEGWVSNLSLRGGYQVYLGGVGIKFISEGWVSSLSLRGGYQVYLGGVGISVCEKFQTTRAKVAPVNLIYGSHFSATEATYKVSLKMVNFVEITRTSSRIRRKPVPV